MELKYAVEVLKKKQSQEGWSDKELDAALGMAVRALQGWDVVEKELEVAIGRLEAAGGLTEAWLERWGLREIRAMKLRIKHEICDHAVVIGEDVICACDWIECEERKSCERWGGAAARAAHYKHLMSTWDMSEQLEENITVEDAIHASEARKALEEVE